MTIRVLVNGALGKMGLETVKAVEQDKELSLVAKTDAGDDLIKMMKDSKAQVVVDFTNANVSYQNAKIIIAAGVHPVIGSTGISSTQVKELQKICLAKKLGGVIAPNFSIGALLMMKYAKEAARYFSKAEIIEMHHDQKIDAPSGTALRTAEMISITKKTPIHSVRLPGLVAHQMVILGGNGETLTIRHDSIDRQAFMPGVMLACKEVMNLNQLIYGLEHLLL